MKGVTYVGNADDTSDVARDAFARQCHFRDVCECVRMLMFVHVKVLTTHLVRHTLRVVILACVRAETASRPRD